MAEGRRPLWQWLAILLLNELALVSLFLPGPILERLHAQEMQLLSAQMGEEAPELLGKWADRWFKWAFIDTGVVEASEGFFQRKENPRDPFDDRGFGNWMHKRVEVMWLAVRYGLYRWGLLLIWLPLLLAAMAPVTLDALCRRDIAEGMYPGMALIVDTKTMGQVHVHLGPTWYLERQEFEVKTGDEVGIKGMTCTKKEKKELEIIAYELTLGDHVLHLRDTQGRPNWEAWRKR